MGAQMVLQVRMFRKQPSLECVTVARRRNSSQYLVDRFVMVAGIKTWIAKRCDAVREVEKQMMFGFLLYLCSFGHLKMTMCQIY